MENIYQGDEEGCGLACLRMLLVYESKDKNYRYLTLDGHPPYSLEALRSTAGKEGLDILFKRAENKNSLMLNKKWPLLLLLGEGKNPHMIFVEKRWRSSLLVYDPAAGREWRKAEEIIEKWDGVFGEVGSYVKERCSYHAPRSPLPFSFIGACFTELLADASLYFAFFFLRDDGNAFYPIVLFACYGFLEIAKRLFSVNAMRSFDKTWLDRIFDPEKARLRKNYEHYYRYKSLLFASILEFVSGLSMTAGLCCLIGFNNAWFFVSVLGIVFYLSAESSLYFSSLQAKKKKIEEREKVLFLSDEVQEKKTEEIHAINEAAYGLGNRLSYEEIIYFILCLVLSMIPSLGKGIWSLNFYLFHLFALFAVGDALKKVISFFEKNAERKAEFDYFLEFFAKNRKG